MILNLIQLISGTATFAEPERTISEATKGVVVSVPETDWIDAGCPSAIEVDTRPSAFVVTGKGSEATPVKPDGSYL